MWSGSDAGPRAYGRALHKSHRGKSDLLKHVGPPSCGLTTCFGGQGASLTLRNIRQCEPAKVQLRSARFNRAIGPTLAAAPNPGLSPRGATPETRRISTCRRPADGRADVLAGVNVRLDQMPPQRSEAIAAQDILHGRIPRLCLHTTPSLKRAIDLVLLSWRFGIKVGGGGVGKSGD